MDTDWLSGVTPRDFVGKSPGSQELRRLAAHLRSREQRRKLGFVKDLIRLDPKAGLYIAKTSVGDTQFFRDLLNDGLETGDASSVSWWLETVLPKLGARTTIRLVQQKAFRDPSAAKNALYWLPRLIDRKTPEIEEMLTKLKNTVDETM